MLNCHLVVVNCDFLGYNITVKLKVACIICKYLSLFIVQLGT